MLPHLQPCLSFCDTIQMEEHIDVGKVAMTYLTTHIACFNCITHTDKNTTFIELRNAFAAWHRCTNIPSNEPQFYGVTSFHVDPSGIYIGVETAGALLNAIVHHESLSTSPHRHAVVAQAIRTALAQIDSYRNGYTFANTHEVFNAYDVRRVFLSALRVKQRGLSSIALHWLSVIESAGALRITASRRTIWRAMIRSNIFERAMAKFYVPGGGAAHALMLSFAHDFN